MADRLCSKSCSLQNPADKSFKEGTLHVYTTLARFLAADGSDRVEINILDIKSQKRSKASPMLMVEPFSGPSRVFKFKTQDDREAVTVAIAQAGDVLRGTGGSAAAAGAADAAAGAAAAAPKAAAGQQKFAVQGEVRVSKELRQELLKSHAVIAQQHKALVEDSQALTDDEFWASAAVLRAAGLIGQPTVGKQSSKRGLANKMVDLLRQNQTDREGRVAQLKMSAEDEQQLLAENPTLRQIYDANVPHQYSREDFWGQYFKYIALKSSRRGQAVSKFKQLQQKLADSSAAAVADMAGQQQTEGQATVALGFFASLESAGLDADTKRAIRRRLNPLVDLAAAAEDKITPDGYGLAHNSARSELESVQGYSALTQELAHDYNVHSAVVIGRPVHGTAAAVGQPGSSAAAAAGKAGSSKALEAGSEATAADMQQFKEQAGLVLEDLQGPLQQHFEELRVTDPRLYFRVMQQQQQQPPPPGKQQQQQQQQGGVKFQDAVQQLRSIDPLNLVDPPMQSAVAQQALHELSGGDVSSSAAARLDPALLPAPLLDFVQQQTMVIDELLRHFWNLLPVNTEEKKAKFMRIRRSMDTCYEILNKRVSACEPQQKVPLTRLVKPLWEQLDHSIRAAQAVERGLQEKRKQAQQRRQEQRA